MMQKRLVAVLSVAFFLSAGYLWAEGLDAGYGQKLPTVFDEGDKIPKLKGKHLKVLKTGVLEAGKTTTLKGVVYEKNALCIAVGYGRGLDSDLDIYVIDSTGNEIGKDVLLDNFPLVHWQSGDDKNVVDIRVANAGKKACSYVLMANY